MIRLMRISQKHRYLIVGGWNTLFGYFCGVSLYYFFSKIASTIEVILAANVLSITMAFFTYKLFVFKTKGNWLKEYLKCYLVYGLISLVGILGLWTLVDLLKMKFWVAQGIIILFTIILSFFSHKNFTFI